MIFIFDLTAHRKHNVCAATIEGKVTALTLQAIPLNYDETVLLLIQCHHTMLQWNLFKLNLILFSTVEQNTGSLHESTK